ncbi:MAG: hydrolase, partial [Candidatus Krumholzibacteriia bacterium]
MSDRPDLPDRLDRERCVLVVVDLQERFRDLIHGFGGVLDAAVRLVRFSQQLQIPVLVSEQYPRGLGVTVQEIRGLLRPFTPLEKLHFSCGLDGGFRKALAATGRDQVLLCGIETHVCVYQTAFDLRRDGHQVALAADAVSSCRATDRALGLDRMRELGVQVMGAQMIMFEVVGRAG